MKKIAAIGLFIILSTNLQGSVFQRNHHITETDGNTRKMVISKAEVNERIRRAVKEAVEKRDEENQGCCKNALLCGCCVGVVKKDGAEP